MPSEVDIANLALTQLGASRITAFTDTTKEARSINQVYALERDDELRAHQWNFATKRMMLAASTTQPPFGYQFSYPLPNDFLRVIAVGYIAPGAMLSIYRGGTDEEEYRVEGNAILYSRSLQLLPTVSPPTPSALPLRYTARISDPNQFDACFIKALASRLAMTLAEVLTSQANKRQLAQGDYKAAIIDAVRANAIELPPEYQNDGTWMRSRLPG